MNTAELKQRGLLESEEESQAIAGERIVLKEDFDELSKADLNRFVIENNLALSLNVTRPQEEMVSIVKALVREHNRALLESTEDTFLPEGFFDMTANQLRKIATDENFDVKVSASKKDLQEALYNALYERSLESED